MPAYEYQCEKCRTIFVNIETFSEHDRHEPVRCPKCDSEKTLQLISLPFVQTARKS